MLKNLPGPLQNREAALELLRQPTSIALLASVGFHALLWFVLPMLPSAEPTELDTSRQVQVVELSPAELNRAPQSAATPPIVFPPSSVPGEIPPIGFSSLPSPSPSPALPSPEEFNRQPPPITILPNSFPPISFPPIFPPPNIPLPSVKPGAPQKQGTKPSPSPSPSPGASPQTSATGTPSAPPSNNAPGSEKASQESLRDRAASLRQIAEADLYASAGEDSDTGISNVEAWLAGFQEKDPTVYKKLVDSRKVIDIPATYPKEACASKLSRGAAVGLVLDSERKIVGEPRLLQRTGSKSLDKAAIEAAGAFDPTQVKDTGDYQLVLLRMEFEYTPENCPDAPPSQEPPAG